MKKVFNYIKSKFGWILLYLFCFYFLLFSGCTCLDFILSCVQPDVYVPFSIADELLSYGFDNLIWFISSALIFYFSCEFEMYIYSYKLYIGKKNWYKFFRECNKVHKKFDSELYKKYLKGEFDINQIGTYNIDYNLFNKVD